MNGPTIRAISRGTVAILCACARPAARGESAARTIAITHVTAIPMDTDRTIPDATIIVSGDRIAAIGRAGDTPVPAHALVIDGRGKFALPGFADMHVHPYDTEGFPSYLAYGITTIAVMHGSPPVLAWRERQRRGVLDGPTVYSASPTVNGLPPGNPLFIAVQDTTEARAVAREQKAAGYDFIKAYSFLNRDVYDALLGEAHKVGIAVVGHIPFQMDYQHVLAAGQANVAHIEEFFQNGDIPDDSMPVIARRVKAAGATVTANLFAYADYLRTIANPAGVLTDPEMRYASPAQYSEKIPTSNRALNRPDLPGFAKFLRERLVRFQMLLRAFDAAGVPILVGTDTETFGFPGQSAYDEMLQMRIAGLSPYKALAAATRNAGEFVARSVPGAERFGTLAVGMRADIVLLRENPLTRIENASSVAGTMTRGRWYPSERITAMRDSVAARTTPQRAFVDRFDSLMTKAKNASAAAALLKQFRDANPDAIPFAELVWGGYGRMQYAQDKISSTDIRLSALDVYSQSHSAFNQVGRAFLFRFDTTTSLTYFRKALAFSPHNLVYQDMVMKLDAARAGPGPDVLGRYEFAPVQVKVAGQPRSMKFVVTLTRAASTTAARVFINGDSGRVATEAVAGPRNVWVTVPLEGNDLELRWRAGAEIVEGTWILGWANNGVLRGRR